MFRVFEPFNRFEAFAVGGLDRYADIYVDSEGGDDANGGTTPKTALQSLSAAQTQALVMGDGVKIALKYGSEWRDELVLSSVKGSQVKPYGDKANGLPVVRGDDPITGTWDTSVDRGDANTEVYSIAWTTIGGGVGIFVSVWEDDEFLYPVETVAECQSTPGSFTTSEGVSQGAVAANTTLYVHPTNSTNPNTDGKQYDATGRRQACIDGGEEAKLIKHVWGRRNAGANGSVNGGGLHFGVLAGEGVKHEMLKSDGVYKKCVAWHTNDDPRTGNISMAYYRSVGEGYSVTYDKCIVIGNSRNATADQNVIGIGGHSGGSDEVGYYGVTVTDSAVYGCEVSLYPQHVVVDRLRLRNGALSAVGSVSSTVKDAWIHLDDFQNAGPYGFPSPEMLIEGMRVYHAANYENFITNDNASSNMTIKNSVFFDINGDGFRRFASLAPTNLTVQGVVLDADNSIAGTTQWKFRDISGSYVGEDNVYWGSLCVVDSPWYFGEYAANYVPQAIADGYEVGSVNADPQMADPANGDFSLIGTGLPANAGLERDPTCQNYLPFPNTLVEAEAWILSNT